ncbi:MAG: hypothetical protein E6H74_09425 [Betaproteobacteria bacterium]|nr:MAG: hypothetical protein E6H74_09425 [Betaproteobacteria bacterium]
MVSVSCGDIGAGDRTGWNCRGGGRRQSPRVGVPLVTAFRVTGAILLLTRTGLPFAGLARAQTPGRAAGGPVA